MSGRRAARRALRSMHATANHIHIRYCACTKMLLLLVSWLLLSRTTALLTSRLLAASLDELVRAASNTCEKLPLQLLASSQPDPELQVFEFSRGGRRQYPLAQAHKRLPLAGSLELYVPGWWNTPTDESSTALAEALLRRARVVLVLDTRPVFCREYVAAVLQVPTVARRLFEFIGRLHGLGYGPARVHLLGFSLGAHVAGVAGRLVRRELHTRLGRISALDPARPCFLQPSARRLRAADARFVYVLHTSTGVAGLERPLGHVDVYANGVSSRQPECAGRALALECEHAQAWRLYAASVGNDSALLGAHCASWDELEKRSCGEKRLDVGYGCSTTARGIFLYTTPSLTRGLRVFSPLDMRAWLER